MKYKIYIVLLLIVGLLGACSRDTILEPTTLAISPNGLISLDSDEHTEVINITTNTEKWTAVKNVDWLSLSQGKGTLTVSVTSNSTTESREAELLIIAGESREKIRIEQSGLDVKISTSQEGVELGQWGGKLSLDVESNNSDWIVECDEEWIHPTPVYAMSEVRITVDETKAREDRVGKIYIKARDGRGLHEISITQRGAMYYLLPSLEFLQSAEDLRAFELGRKSEVMQVPDDTFNLYNWGFKVKSEAFSQVTYLVYNNRYKTAKVFCANADFFKDRLLLEGQKTFLLRNGFEQKEDLVFFHPEKKVVARIEKDASAPHVYYTYRPEQPSAQPTMTTFPYRYMTFSQGAFDKISAWETAHSGTLNAQRSDIDNNNFDRDILWFDISEGPLLACVYRVSRATTARTITSSFLILKDSSQVYYTAGGTIHLTQEFIDFMKAEGFTSLGDAGPGYRFYHLDKEIDVLVSLVKFDGIDDPKVQIQVSPLS